MEDETNGTKACIVCSSSLDIPETWSENLRRFCKYLCLSCYNEDQKAHNARWRAANRAKASENVKAWRLANPEKYRAILEAAKAKRKQNAS